MSDDQKPIPAVDPEKRNIDEWLSFIDKALRVGAACLVIYVAYSVISTVWGWLNKPPQPKSSPSRPADLIPDYELIDVQKRLLSLKASLKNPDSFQLNSAHLTQKQVLCVKFRGTNSFNAIVTQQIAINPEYKPVDWGKSCNNVKAYDYSDALTRKP